jgi:hypothetical protein
VLWRQEHLRRPDLNYFQYAYILSERTVKICKLCQILLGDALTNQMIGTGIMLGDGNLRLGYYNRLTQWLLFVLHGTALKICILPT